MSVLERPFLDRIDLPIVILVFDCQQNAGVTDVDIVVKFFATNGANSFTTEEAKLSFGIYVALTIIADIFIVYRVFAVWCRSLVVSAVPCLLLVSGIISGGLMATRSSKLNFKEPQASGLLTTFYCITLVLNVLCTGLIASRLYLLERQTPSSSLRLRWTSMIVIESAALYLACVIAVVVCNVVKADGAHLIVFTSTPSIVGLTFSLIIVRTIGSSGTPNKTLTSIDDISRGSVLQFGTGHRTVDGDEGFVLHTLSNTVASTSPTTVTQAKSVPSDFASDDIEDQAGRDMRYH
ncbi:hypothetical protein PQX77_001030 [Marasmius sp. AFHP31]|nr:hypothetical protein PQX77_001030 [Marasmius sp. AFHP31]